MISISVVLHCISYTMKYHWSKIPFTYWSAVILSPWAAFLLSHWKLGSFVVGRAVDYFQSLWFSHQVSPNPASNYHPISAKQSDLHLVQFVPQITIQEIACKRREKQRANNIHFFMTTQMHLLWSAVRYLSVNAVIIVFIIKLNQTSTEYALMFASTQHSNHYLLLKCYSFLPLTKTAVHKFQIMIPTVRVLSQDFLFLLLLSHQYINPSFVRNSLVNLLMKHQYLSFNEITTLPHMSYRRDGI